VPGRSCVVGRAAAWGHRSAAAVVRCVLRWVVVRPCQFVLPGVVHRRGVVGRQAGVALHGAGPGGPWARWRSGCRWGVSCRCPGGQVLARRRRLVRAGGCCMRQRALCCRAHGNWLVACRANCSGWRGLGVSGRCGCIRPVALRLSASWRARGWRRCGVACRVCPSLRSSQHVAVGSTGAGPAPDIRQPTLAHIIPSEVNN